MQAMEAENRTLRSRLSCLEEQLRHASAGAERASSTSDCISTPTHTCRPCSSCLFWRWRRVSRRPRAHGLSGAHNTPHMQAL